MQCRQQGGTRELPQPHAVQQGSEVSPTLPSLLLFPASSWHQSPSQPIPSQGPLAETLSRRSLGPKLLLPAAPAGTGTQPPGIKSIPLPHCCLQPRLTAVLPGLAGEVYRSSKLKVGAEVEIAIRYFWLPARLSWEGKCSALAVFYCRMRPRSITLLFRVIAEQDLLSTCLPP